MENSSMDQNENQKQATTQSSCQINVELQMSFHRNVTKMFQNVKNVFQ